MQHCHGVVVALEQTGDAIRAVLCPAKDEDGIVIHSFEQLDEQVGFFANRKRDK